MLKIMRKFSIMPSRGLLDNNGDLQLDKSYPVLAMNEVDDITFVLIADDVNEFHWVDLADCFIASIDE